MEQQLNILILSFYYYPDLCAGSFRCTQLVEQLQQQVDKEASITIITTLPNRYASYNQTALSFEQQGNTSMHRIALPKHKSNIIDQVKAFIVYAKAVAKLTKNKQYDLVFATSSRLMTATLGSYIAQQTKAKLYLDIRDIFVDTISDIFSKKISLFAKPFFTRLERWTFNKADHINLVSYGFNDYFKQSYPKIPLSFYTNGIDPEFMIPVDSCSQSKPPQKIPIVLYAGNIGEGQGLHLIVPDLAKQCLGQFHFRIIGDGGRIQQLKAAIADLSNVEILNPVNREQLLKEYQQADILFLHLNKHNAFLKVLPSKVFEYAAIGKPILAGVGGYAAQFIKQEVDNAVVFEPCNSIIAQKALSQLRLESLCRDQFIKKYDRKHIMREMSEHIVGLMEASVIQHPNGTTLSAAKGTT